MMLGEETMLDTPVKRIISSLLQREIKLRNNKSLEEAVGALMSLTTVNKKDFAKSKNEYSYRQSPTKKTSLLRYGICYS